MVHSGYHPLKDRHLRIVFGCGYQNVRINSTRARVDHVTSDHMALMSVIY